MCGTTVIDSRPENSKLTARIAENDTELVVQSLQCLLAVKSGETGLHEELGSVFNRRAGRTPEQFCRLMVYPTADERLLCQIADGAYDIIGIEPALYVLMTDGESPFKLSKSDAPSPNSVSWILLSNFFRAIKNRISRNDKDEKPVPEAVMDWAVKKALEIAIDEKELYSSEHFCEALHFLVELGGIGVKSLEVIKIEKNMDRLTRNIAIRDVPSLERYVHDLSMTVHYNIVAQQQAESQESQPDSVTEKL